MLMCVLMHNCARALARTVISRLRPLVELLLFFIRGHMSTIIIINIDFQFGLCLINWGNFRIQSQAYSVECKEDGVIAK